MALRPTGAKNVQTILDTGANSALKGLRLACESEAIGQREAIMAALDWAVNGLPSPSIAPRLDSGDDIQEDGPHRELRDINRQAVCDMVKRQSRLSS